MLDIKWIRENPEALDKALAVARRQNRLPAEIVELDEKRRSVVQRLQEMQSRRNAASKEIGAGHGSSKDMAELAEKLKAEVLGDSRPRCRALEAEEREATAALDDLLAGIPNVPLDDVPVGADEEADNVEIRQWGQKPGWNHPAKEHFRNRRGARRHGFRTCGEAVGFALHCADRRICPAGTRAWSVHDRHAHQQSTAILEVSPPLLVRDEALYRHRTVTEICRRPFQGFG